MTEQHTDMTTALPRVAITYCTQCKWMLRAAWMSQELLQTFGTSIGEVALIPATGGIFTVRLKYMPPAEIDRADGAAKFALIWDRKRDGGFPEAKILKQLIRNHIDPEKSLGHSDTPSSTKSQASTTAHLDASNKVVGTQHEKLEPADHSTAVHNGTEPCEDCR